MNTGITKNGYTLNSAIPSAFTLNGNMTNVNFVMTEDVGAASDTETPDELDPMVLVIVALAVVVGIAGAVMWFRRKN